MYLLPSWEQLACYSALLPPHPQPIREPRRHMSSTTKVYPITEAPGPASGTQRPNLFTPEGDYRTGRKRGGWGWCWDGGVEMQLTETGPPALKRALITATPPEKHLQDRGHNEAGVYGRAVNAAQCDRHRRREEDGGANRPSPRTLPPSWGFPPGC